MIHNFKVLFLFFYGHYIENLTFYDDNNIVMNMMMTQGKQFSFYEFFAGGGMARLGLGAPWSCLFANDNCTKKAESYKINFAPADELHVGNIEQVSIDMLPDYADMLWASFPCQDLSLAGNGAGLAGNRSGVFWSFWEIVKGLNAAQRKPKIIVLENVEGAVTSNDGKDFKVIVESLTAQSYSVGSMIMDAVHFVPQSRPRLFVIGIDKDLAISEELVTTQPVTGWHTDAILKAHKNLSGKAKKNWLWFNLLKPTGNVKKFSDLIEDAPTGTKWHSKEETAYLLSLMNKRHQEKVNSAIETSLQEKRRMVGGVYKRTRNGQQRAEVRFDDIAGCLRTPKGGSSRQSIIVVDGNKVRSRLLSTREAARLMGIDDTYILPEQYNQAYQLAGDGLAVPVVRHLSEYLLLPLLESQADLKLVAE